MENIRKLEEQLAILEDQFARFEAEVELWSGILEGTIASLRESIDREACFDGYSKFAKISTPVGEQTCEVFWQARVGDRVRVPAPDNEHWMDATIVRLFLEKPENVKDAEFPISASQLIDEVME